MAVPPAIRCVAIYPHKSGSVLRPRRCRTPALLNWEAAPSRPFLALAGLELPQQGSGTFGERSENPFAGRFKAELVPGDNHLMSQVLSRRNGEYLWHPS